MVGPKALLLVGPAPCSIPDRELARRIGRIGEVLLASDARWRVRRSELPSRPGSGAIESELEALLDVDDVVLIAAVAARPALPLSLLRRFLASCRARAAVLLIAGWSDEADHQADVWLASVASGSPSHLIAVAAADAVLPALEATIDALSGLAVDPRTGTVTLRSLGECLARGVPELALQHAAASETVIAGAPLAGSWDPRLGRLSRNSEGVAHAGRPAPDDLTGSVLPGRFRLDRRIARGGFGAVYRARQLNVERDVAVKVLHESIDPASVAGRLFVHEVQGVGKLDHPNVVRIFQADVTSDGRLFYAMELLSGQDLESLLMGGNLEPGRAIALAGQLLAALGAAHEAGLVHADVKPGNAVVVPGRHAERLVLVDFGLSRLHSPQPSRSAGGTPAFMAPEQLHSGRVDARSDLFAAALVLVTMLTGWRRRSAKELRPPLEVIADARLRSMLDRALALDPADRFQSAADLANALSCKIAPGATEAPRRGPFDAAPLGEADAARLHGREREIADLLDRALYGSGCVLVGERGVGKTSLLQAGLVPRLRALGVRVVDGEGFASEVTMAEPARTVVIVDELDERSTARRRLEASRPTADVAMIVTAGPEHGPLHGWLPTVELGPLDEAGARAVLESSLAGQRMNIEPALVRRLLDDLSAHGRTGVSPADLQRTGAALVAALPSDQATLTLPLYEGLGDRLGGSLLQATAPTRRSRAATVGMVALLGAIAVAAVVGLLKIRAAGPAAPARPVVLVGGSGTVLWGFLQPLAGFLEQHAAITLPLSTSQDHGSGGAVRELRKGAIRIAAMAGRFDGPLPPELQRSGERLIEVAIGFDETTLFVHRDNPVREIDVAAFRANLCCAGSATTAATWRDLGLYTSPFAGERVEWTLFGRNGPPGGRRTTSSTLAQADEWFCAGSALCPASEPVDVDAHEILHGMSRSPRVLALSSRSFATADVHPVATVDRERGTRLDGRKTLWLYLALRADRPVPAELCRFLDAVLDEHVTQRLERAGKARGLPDRARRGQRVSLGLDDGTCGTRRVRDLAPVADGLIRSPIAEDIEIRERWVPATPE